MAEERKIIPIRNEKTGVETTMLADRWKLRHARLEREGWVITDPEEHGIEVKAPAQMTTKEKVEKAQKDMGVKAETPEPPKADNQPDEVVEKIAASHWNEDMDVKELKEYADAQGIDYAKNAGKKKMIEILSK